jgi:hypothetical protein
MFHVIFDCVHRSHVLRAAASLAKGRIAYWNFLDLLHIYRLTINCPTLRQAMSRNSKLAPEINRYVTGEHALSCE